MRLQSKAQPLEAQAMRFSGLSGLRVCRFGFGTKKPQTPRLFPDTQVHGTFGRDALHGHAPTGIIQADAGGLFQFRV